MNPREALQSVTQRLAPLGIKFAFLGGAVVEFLVDDPSLIEFRPTKDVDVLVEVVTHAKFIRFEEQLRAIGFQHDTSEDAPICRWRVDKCIVDVMPADGKILGLGSRWFKEALATATLQNIGNGVSARVVSPSLFLTTKLAAFEDRGKNDFYGSRDIEDIVTVIDGREAIVEEARQCTKPVRAYLTESFSKLLKTSNFLNAIPGHMSPGQTSQQRIPIVLERMRGISNC